MLQINKFQRLVYASALPLVFAHAAAVAQNPNSPGMTVEQLTEMQGSTALINAETARVKAQAALQEAKNELQEAVVKGTTGGVSQDASSEATLTPEAIPQVISIYGSGKRIYALLRYPSGFQMDVRPKEQIDGGFVVKSITSSRVVLTRDDKEYVLRGAAPSAPPRQSANGNPMNPMMPGSSFMPMMQSPMGQMVGAPSGG